MAVISVYILLTLFGFSRVHSDAYSTYCSLPCPFMCPAQPASSAGAILLPPRRPKPAIRPEYTEVCTDYDDQEESDPVPVARTRKKSTCKNSDGDSPPSPPPKPKPKPPPPPEDPEVDTRKKEKPPSPPAPPSPSIQPSRRFFTSLFSIPGAVVDSLVGGEIVL